MADVKPLLAAFAELFKKDMQEQFGSEGGNSGGWAPLTPAYEAWKADHYPGRPIGVLTGALSAAMTGGSGYMQEISDFGARMGMSPGSAASPYGKYFDAGNTRGMPARHVIEISGAQAAEWTAVAHEWLSSVIHGGGGPWMPGAIARGWQGS